MNILIANWTWYPSGGDWTYINSICKLYEANGHHIIPFSVKNEKNFPTQYDKYFLTGVDYKSFYNRIPLKSGIAAAIKSIYSIEAKQKLKSLLRDTRVDIAQLNNITSYHTPSIIPVLKKANIPVVWRILDYRLICPDSSLLSNGKLCEACYKHRYYNCIYKKCKKNSLLASALLAIESYVYSILPFYKQVDKYLFQSEFTRDMFVKFGYDVKKTHIIENPYDCKNVQPKYGGKNYILYFGRLSKEKGLYTLLDAMKAIPDSELKIVGNGPEHDSLVNYATEKSIHNVSFLGPKWDKDLEPVIKDCEFVVVPSEWHEPSPYVVLQSFSYGKPVVAADRGGLNDLIDDYKNGLFFKAGDSKNLTEKITFMLQNTNLVYEMGQNARMILEKKHSPDRYYADTIHVFNNLIN